MMEFFIFIIAYFTHKNTHFIKIYYTINYKGKYFPDNKITGEKLRNLQKCESFFNMIKSIIFILPLQL